MLKPDITAFFDPATSTYSYVVRDPSSRACAIVDPVLDYDPAAGRTSHASAERLIAHVRQHDLQVEWLLETHVHADHLSAAIFLQRELGGCLAIGARITQVQAKFSGLFNLGEAFPVDGRQFEHLFEDGESFRIGALECRAAYPGAYPGVHDLPGRRQRLRRRYPVHARLRHRPLRFPRRRRAPAVSLDPAPVRATRRDPPVHVPRLHGSYRDEHRCETSVGEQRRHNVHVREGVDEEAFVAMRQQRDATLGMPTLMLPAIQVNMRGGNLPPVEGNGVRYLKIPLDLF